MFSTGCRIGEIVSLEKNDINWSNRSAIVRGNDCIVRLKEGEFICIQFGKVALVLDWLIYPLNSIQQLKIKI
ncbi:site-specific integrase [Viridibacillus soli]|uniref:hypothetical protein n=1 Tax=Viridibacillus soli TaxID=2798301 RepID=UPI001F431A24|nr:hypothetical protein [Viridibacillus soli]